MFVFFVSDKNGHIKSCSSFEDLLVYKNFMVPRWRVQVLHPPQKSERPAFWNGWRYGVKKYGVEVAFNGKFHKNLSIGSNVIRGGTQTDGQADRQTGDLISLAFLFKESRLIRIPGEISGSHGGEYEDDCLLGCCAV
jgi:hypothetical protein